MVNINLKLVKYIYIVLLLKYILCYISDGLMIFQKNNFTFYYIEKKNKN